MKVILLENLKKIGSIGEVIEVKRGFARNFLIANKKALYASKENISQVEKIKSELSKKDNEKKQDAKKIAEKLKLFTLAEALGGVESLCCHPASMTHSSITPEDWKKSGLVDSLLRLSVGIEDVDDLIEYLKQAIG